MNTQGWYVQHGKIYDVYTPSSLVGVNTVETYHMDDDTTTT